MHVDPKEVCPGVFGDHVVDHWNESVKPGASRQHEVTLPLRTHRAATGTTRTCTAPR